MSIINQWNHLFIYRFFIHAHICIYFLHKYYHAFLHSFSYKPHPSTSPGRITMLTTCNFPVFIYPIHLYKELYIILFTYLCHSYAATLWSIFHCLTYKNDVSYTLFCILFFLLSSSSKSLNIAPTPPCQWWHAMPW